MCLMIKTPSLPTMTGFLYVRYRVGHPEVWHRGRKRNQREIHHLKPVLHWSGAHLHSSSNGSRTLRVLQSKVSAHHHDLGGEGALHQYGFYLAVRAPAQKGLIPPA